MEKPGNWFAIEKMWKKHPKKKVLSKESASLRSSCSRIQPPSFSVRRTSTPNGFLDTINWLKILMGYTKQLPQLKHGVLFHLKIENLELFVNF